MESLRIIESVLGYSGDFFSALALEGGAHDSGRAWSSQGLLVAGYSYSVRPTAYTTAVRQTAKKGICRLRRE